MKYDPEIAMVEKDIIDKLQNDLAVSRVFTESAREELSAREAKEQEYIRQIVELKFGFTSGTIVSIRGKKYRVVGVEKYWDLDRPWLEANPQRSDGTFGTARRILYSDWEVVK